MKPERRTFVRVDDEAWIEPGDFKARWPDREPSWTGTCFAVLFSDLAAAEVRDRVLDCRYVDVYGSMKPAGAWLTGGYHWLEQALIQVQQKGAAEAAPKDQEEPSHPAWG